ncbi:MAG TPA: trypsin-like peptidase domain-containing protein [Gemmatimonadales bacterium]|nr:trypsin-like peptidase domain-containing protein [Gemmatimonadales bacterium]
MKAQFKFLSGARAGQTESVAKAYIGIGRHPLSDVRFDSERDLDVSIRHAAILRRAAGYVLQDLGSKNGTWLNGQKVTGDAALASGDVVSFGPKGPAVEFRTVETEGDPLLSTADAAIRPSRPAGVVPAAVAPAPRAGERAPRSSTAVRVAQEVARQTRDLRRTTKVLLSLLVVTVAAFGVLQWKGTRDRARELAELRARADSLALEGQRIASQLQSELAGLRDALTQAQTETEQLRGELAAGGNAETMARLRNALAAAESRQRALLGAAGVDYRAISRANQDAVVLLVVEYGPGQVVSGTGFAIDSQGTIVTNRHVLTGEDGGRRPTRIGVMFAGSAQLFRGDVVAVAEDIDIGIVRTAIRGGNPHVAGLVREREGVERGDPVAMLGYPLGFDLPMDRNGTVPIADPSLIVGTVSKVLTNLVQVDGYGAPGASGSAVFDRRGRVVGVLFGGQRESDGRIVYAVPSHLLVRFLESQGLLRR